MKKFIILFLAMMMAFGVGAQQYALHYGALNGPVMGANDTTEYNTTADDLNITHMAYLFVYIENLTNGPLETDNEIMKVEGPDGLVTEVCAGGFCPQMGSYTLEPGDNDLMPIIIEPHLEASYVGQSILYRVTVGNANGLANSVTTYIKVNIGTQGIDDVEVDGKKTVYPNPTTGKVTVGDEEYDLSDRPAGVYFINTGKGTARVIKL